MHSDSPRHVASRWPRRLLQMAVKVGLTGCWGHSVQSQNARVRSGIGENLQVVGAHGHLAEMLPPNCGYTRRFWVFILSVATLLAAGLHFHFC